MPEKNPLKLTCPVCETRLKIGPNINRFACLNCGTELSVNIEGELAHLALVENNAGTNSFSEEEKELIEINSTIRAKDDSYGVGCAVATLGISATACISSLIASAINQPILLAITLIIALVLLAFVVLLFIMASSKETDPLLRKRDKLQSLIKKDSATD